MFFQPKIFGFPWILELEKSWGLRKLNKRVTAFFLTSKSVKLWSPCKWRGPSSKNRVDETAKHFLSACNQKATIKNHLTCSTHLLHAANPDILCGQIRCIDVFR